jgi:hypothetical protein
MPRYSNHQWHAVHTEFQDIRITNTSMEQSPPWSFNRLLKKLHALYGTLGFPFLFTRERAWGPYPEPYESIPQPHTPFTIHFSITLPPTASLWRECSSHVAQMCYWFHTSNPPWFDHPITFGQEHISCVIFDVFLLLPPPYNQIFSSELCYQTPPINLPPLLSMIYHNTIFNANSCATIPKVIIEARGTILSRWGRLQR